MKRFSESEILKMVIVIVVIGRAEATARGGPATHLRAARPQGRSAAGP